MPTSNRRGLFLDRDGVLNVDHGYVGTQDRWEWVEGAKEAVAAATRAGWLVFIATNQSGIARGLYTEADLHALMDWAIAELAAAGGTITDWRYCPHHPDATLPAYRPACACRKPSPGMLLRLIDAWQPHVAGSLAVGDAARDREAAVAAGIPYMQFDGGNLLEALKPMLGT